MILPKFDTLKITDPNYRRIYLQCLSTLHDNIDAKTFKSYAAKYAKEHAVEPRLAFLALEDWSYVTLGKLVYLESHKFPLTKNAKKWIEKKIAELIEEGKRAIAEKRNVEVSPILEKSDKVMTPKDVAAKIIALVEEDKLAKDREAPVKIVALENVTDHIDKIVKIIESHHVQYTDEAEHKKLMDGGMKYSTIVRRRNEFGRVIRQVRGIKPNAVSS